VLVKAISPPNSHVPRDAYFNFVCCALVHELAKTKNSAVNKINVVFKVIPPNLNNYEFDQLYVININNN
jgi:hypothetical protein